jgi:hypothetical protein
MLVGEAGPDLLVVPDKLLVVALGSPTKDIRGEADVRAAAEWAGRGLGRRRDGCRDSFGANLTAAAGRRVDERIVLIADLTEDRDADPAL